MKGVLNIDANLVLRGTAIPNKSPNWGECILLLELTVATRDASPGWLG